MSHTPGPWTIRRYVSGGLAFMSGDRLVGGIPSTTKPTEQEEVDARLIASAPDLLAACRAVLNVLRCADGVVVLDEDVLKIVRVAVAKVTAE